MPSTLDRFIPSVFFFFTSSGFSIGDLSFIVHCTITSVQYGQKEKYGHFVWFLVCYTEHVLGRNPFVYLTKPSKRYVANLCEYIVDTSGIHQQFVDLIKRLIE